MRHCPSTRAGVRLTQQALSGPSPLVVSCPIRGRSLGRVISRYRRNSKAAADAARAGSGQGREEHNRFEAQEFDEDVDAFREPLPDDIKQRLREIVGAVPNLGPESRVMDVGSGTGCLVPFLRERGVQDILAVDVSAKMLQANLAENGGGGSSLGNEPGLRTWQGDVQSIPPYQGPFDAAFFNAVFGNVYHQRDTLLRTALLLRPGGWITISHPLGSEWLASLSISNPELVPHVLPNQAALETLICDLPLQLVSLRDEKDLYLALLQVPPSYVLPRAPVRLCGAVTTGFGRGSRQMGVPTANLPPEPLAETLDGLPLGVYFGWARLDAAEGSPEADSQVHKMVLNIGKRPTVDDGAGLTVEAHVLHAFAADFYGRDLRLLVTGYLRPEMRFDGLPALIARIKTDVGLARGQLDSEPHASLREESFLS